MKPTEIKQYFNSLGATEFYAAWGAYISAVGAVPAGFSGLVRRASEFKRVQKMLEFDRTFGEVVAGVDEAGRGPLAGPVFAAAVIFPQGVMIEGLNDSKKLSEKKRDELFDEITAKALCYGIASVDNVEIDRINIRNATFKAMRAAIEGMNAGDIHESPENAIHILIDGDSTASILLPCTAVVKGDSKSHAIAAASVLAKVSRDRFMLQMNELYPQYGFADHKGYGTAVHTAVLRKLGATPIHRETFISNFVGSTKY